jgi:hypothetical protein
MDGHRQGALADVVEVARAITTNAGDVVRNHATYQHLLRWIVTCGLYMVAVHVLLGHVAAVDDGRFAQRFPHLALCLALTGVYVAAVWFEHVAAALLCRWDPTLLADYFAPHRLDRRVRQVVATVGVVLAFGTSEVGMWLLPLPDQEGPAARMAATAVFVVMVGRWLACTIKRLRAVRVGDRLRELAAALRAERELEQERSGS